RRARPCRSVTSATRGAACAACGRSFLGGARSRRQSKHAGRAKTFFAILHVARLPRYAPRMRALFFAAVLASLAASARPASACATAPPYAVRVQIAEESAIIVWDEQQKREHFIRRASFHTTGKDFGFLVPTPDKPELAEVPDHVFDQLDLATRPDV